MLSQNFKLVADLMKTPGHADLWQGKNQEHVEKIIPERVFLFGLQCVIVVFPYHTYLPTLVAFGQALHQANRLENLVQLFNAESHTIKMKPVHGIDDAIAKLVFDKCVKKKWICIFP